MPHEAESNRDYEYLFDVADAMRLALEFAAGMTRDQFQRDIKTQDAIIRRLTVLGEAVKRISPATRDRYPNVP